MLCSHCGAEIPTSNIKPGQRLVQCVQCKAAINLAQDPNDSPTPTYPKQLGRPLPGGLTVEETEEELIITWPWSSFGSLLWLVGIFICSGGMLLGSTRLSWQGFPSLIAGGFLLIGTVVGFYIILSMLVNKATIRVNPAALSISHGPLPLWRTLSLDSPQIKQLYVDEKISSAQGSAAYHYQLYVLTKAGKSINLFPDANFNAWDKVLYLEQAIESHLKLSDIPLLKEPTSPSLNPLKSQTDDGWRKLAETHHLDFVERSPLKGAYLSGLYRGQHYLELDTVSNKRSDGDEIHTRLLLSDAGQRGDVVTLPEIAENDVVTFAQVAHVLARPGPFPRLKGEGSFKAGGQEVYYEQAGVEGDEAYLQFLFDAFSDLLAAYPKIITLGGEAVPALQTILKDETHPFHRVAPQLLTEIAETTTRRWADRLPHLRCSRCLGWGVDFTVSLSPLKSLTYYGCQSCGQSQHFFKFEGQVVAVLDSAMTAPRVEQAAVLRVNWLARRTLFSFDAVEIVRATDEAVERFAILVGNDTDSMRQPRYQEMRCLVSADCDLTENTLRVLRRTFGEVYRTDLESF